MLHLKCSFGGLCSNPVTGGPRLSEIPQSVLLHQDLSGAKCPRHDCNDPLPESKPSSSKENFQLDDKDFMCMICGQVLKIPTLALVGTTIVLTVSKVVLNAPSVIKS